MTRPGGTFGIPIVLALISAAALVAGLLGDGVVDVIAWVGLAVPLIVIALYLSRAGGAPR